MLIYRCYVTSSSDIYFLTYIGYVTSSSDIYFNYIGYVSDCLLYSSSNTEILKIHQADSILLYFRNYLDKVKHEKLICKLQGC